MRILIQAKDTLDPGFISSLKDFAEVFILVPVSLFLDDELENFSYLKRITSKIIIVYFRFVHESIQFKTEQFKIRL